MALRVAAYCRVSTEQDDQLNSLANQKRYFDEYIRRQPGWQLVEVYADEGLSGTSSKNRPAFQKMIAAAKRGEIDLILTKEVSRFARNTIDTLAHTRDLRKLGVGVIFINDNIDTRQNDGEFRLTIMASVAQEESRKTSERVKWGQKRSMENGVVFGCNNMYGYDLQNGRLRIRPDQAEVVRLIYHKFLHEGKGTHVIARELYEAGIAAPKAKDKPWSAVMIYRILKNEKYCGDLLQKKSYTPNYLDHKKMLNHGAEEQVYLRAHHEGIISHDLFERTQQELKRRAPSAAQAARYSNRYWCSGKIRCGSCGERFMPRRRTRSSGFVYQYWVCHAKGHFGRKKLDTQGRAVGCSMRSIHHQTICACMEYVIRQLPIDVDALIREVLALLEREKPQTHEIEQLQARQQRCMQKKDTVLDAYFEQTISKEELERLRSRYDIELAQLGKRLSVLASQQTAAQRTNGSADEVRCFLQRQAFCAESVFGELLERFTVYEDSVTIKLNGISAVFRIGYTTSGQMEHYQTNILSCDMIDL